MKAFQLKIVINNSKPPIWRRVIIPAGITFSQLSMILNEVMGWCGYHVFQFELYHRELYIMENADEFSGGYGTYDYLEASRAFIREYLEENDWFTYVYDMGDSWKHRVTIEKDLEDYELNYPVVLKYKGDCPPEDCGGIWRYYEYLDAVEDEKHPEHEEWLTWLETHGFPVEYDMSEVNHILKERFFYKWGDGEVRTQSELYKGIFEGEYGLYATSDDENSSEGIIRSGRHQLNERLEGFARAVQLKHQWEMSIKCLTLKMVFEDFEKEHILEIIKDKGISEALKGNKTTLIKQLVDFMLRPEVMEGYFLCLTDEEIEVFERAAMSIGFYNGDDTDALSMLYEACYIGMLEDGRVSVPRDVWNVYNSFKGTYFDIKRRKVNYLLQCLRASDFLYGIVPLQVLVKLVNTHPELDMSTVEIKEAIEKIPPEFNEYIVINGKVYHEDFYPDDRGLLEVQGDKKYYIPTMDEIMALGNWGCIMETSEMKELMCFIHKKLKVKEEEAVFIATMIQTNIAAGASMQEIMGFLDDVELSVKNQKQLEKLVQCINNLWNNTRMVLNRGFTPLELLEAEKSPLLTVAKSHNIINFQDAKKQKIYPNDPCPCGSGRKYKNCCKNK